MFRSSYLLYVDEGLRIEQNWWSWERKESREGNNNAYRWKCAAFASLRVEPLPDREIDASPIVSEVIEVIAYT